MKTSTLQECNRHSGNGTVSKSRTSSSREQPRTSTWRATLSRRPTPRGHSSTRIGKPCGMTGRAGDRAAMEVVGTGRVPGWARAQPNLVHNSTSTPRESLRKARLSSRRILMPLMGTRLPHLRGPSENGMRSTRSEGSGLWQFRAVCCGLRNMARDEGAR
jgi:hypothetical protein